MAQTLSLPFGFQQRQELQKGFPAPGTSAHALLDEARYVKALELLANERLSLDEIASQSGFANDESFRKAFQRWAHKTPGQIRREMRQGEQDEVIVM